MIEAEGGSAKTRLATAGLVVLVLLQVSCPHQWFHPDHREASFGREAEIRPATVPSATPRPMPVSLTPEQLEVVENEVKGHLKDAAGSARLSEVIALDWFGKRTSVCGFVNAAGHAGEQLFLGYLQPTGFHLSYLDGTDVADVVTERTYYVDNHHVDESHPMSAAEANSQCERIRREKSGG